MRLGAVHIAALAMLLTAWLVPTEAQAQAIASWNEMVHDYGTAHENDGEQRCTFIVTNTGDQPLVITQVKPTCGCTVAQYTTSAIEPGKSGTVDVTYSPTGRPGPFEKTIWVYTNSMGEGRQRLIIKGVTIGSPASVSRYFPEEAAHLMVTRTIIAAGEVTKGKIRNNIITAYNATADTLLLTCDNNTSHINLVAKPDTIAPGGISTISLFFNSMSTPVWGINDDNISLITRPLHSPESEEKTAVINLVANVVEDFSQLTDQQLAQAPTCTIADTKIVLNNLAGNTPVTTTLQVKNTGKSDLVIHRVMSLDKALRCSINHTLLKPGHEATITVKVDPTLVKDGLLNSEFTIISNDPASPRVTVRVVGH